MPSRRCAPSPGRASTWWWASRPARSRRSRSTSPCSRAARSSACSGAPGSARTRRSTTRASRSSWPCTRRARSSPTSPSASRWPAPPRRSSTWPAARPWARSWSRSTEVAWFGALPPNVRGALWMLASALGFTAMAVLIKFLGDDYPSALQTFYRQAAGFVILLPLILKRRSAAFATTRPGILFFRSAAGTLGMILSFYAFQEMPLADANALSFTRTLWLVPLAAFVVRETVGPLRIGAAVVGFLGVLLMVRPGAGGEFALGLPALA